MKKRLLTPISILGLSSILAASGGDGSGVSSKPATEERRARPPQPPATVRTASTSLGTILVATNDFARSPR